MSKPWIVKDPDHAFGAARVRGMNLRADVLVAMVRAGEIISTIAWWYEVPEAAVRAALRYAKNHPEELEGRS